MSQLTKQPQKENLFISLLFNVAIPVFVLSKLSSVFGAQWTLILALVFPLCYACFDFYKRRIANPISILGFFSVLIKGLFALYQVDGFWFAVQEATIPIFLGLAMFFSVWLGKPLINYFLYNDNIFKIALLEQKLQEYKTEALFRRLIWQVTCVFGSAFFLGGILNYFLARMIIVSPAGSVAFNEEFAKMTMYSYLVVMAPKMLISFLGLWWFVHQLKKLTKLSLNEILHVEEK